MASRSKRMVEACLKSNQIKSNIIAYDKTHLNIILEPDDELMQVLTQNDPNSSSQNNSIEKPTCDIANPNSDCNKKAVTTFLSDPEISPVDVYTTEEQNEFNASITNNYFLDPYLGIMNQKQGSSAYYCVNMNEGEEHSFVAQLDELKNDNYISKNEGNGELNEEECIDNGDYDLENEDTGNIDKPEEKQNTIVYRETKIVKINDQKNIGIEESDDNDLLEERQNSIEDPDYIPDRGDSGGETDDQENKRTKDRCDSQQLKIKENLTEDPDYLSENRDSDDEETASQNMKGRPKQGRKRKYPNQNGQIRKKHANTNEEYYNAKGQKVNAKQFQNFICYCRMKCTDKVSLEIRKAEFEKYWKAGSYEARCALMQGSVKEIKKKRSYSANSKRQYTRKYYFSNVEVCKNTYLNTLGISQTRIDFALSKFRLNQTINDNRGINSGGKNAISNEKIDKIKNFINSIPKYTSHYCRESTTANFLSPNLNLQILYDLYKEKHPDGVSLSKFKSIFYNDFNLRFKKPQKDTCLRCDTFKAKVQTVVGDDAKKLRQEHEKHLDQAYSLRNQMKADLALAKTDSSIETLTFDLEKTHSLPRLPTSIVYYKRQLNLYNQGIHCGSSGKEYFYIWLEHEAGRGTQEVGSCLRKFILENLKTSAKHLILWGDSCGGQNRSIKLVLMLQHILENHLKLETITLRFLQPGHTYLPNDSEFGDVECALKTHTRLYTDLDYIHVMTKCRRKNPFSVTRLKKEDFRSISPILNRITNRKVDVEKNKISWLRSHEICIKKNCPNRLYMKSRLEDEPQIVDISKGRKNKILFDGDLPLLWPDGRELSQAKIKDLKEILNLIPTDSKNFYAFLRTIRAGNFVDDAEGFGAVIDFILEENDLD